MFVDTLIALTIVSARTTWATSVGNSVTWSKRLHRLCIASCSKYSALNRCVELSEMAVRTTSKSAATRAASMPSVRLCILSSTVISTIAVFCTCSSSDVEEEEDRARLLDGSSSSVASESHSVRSTDTSTASESGNDRSTAPAFGTLAT